MWDKSTKGFGNRSAWRGRLINSRGRARRVRVQCLSYPAWLAPAYLDLVVKTMWFGWISFSKKSVFCNGWTGQSASFQFGKRRNLNVVDVEEKYWQDGHCRRLISWRKTQYISFLTRFKKKKKKKAQSAGFEKRLLHEKIWLWGTKFSFCQMSVWMWDCVGSVFYVGSLYNNNSRSCVTH